MVEEDKGKENHSFEFSGRTGGLMRNTSRIFFVLTMLQFSLRNGNVCYDATCGT